MRIHTGLLPVLAAVGLLAACARDETLDLSGKLYPVPIEEADGKDDGVGQAALPIDADVGETEVWKVRNQWADRDSTLEARAAGIAWGASSGLSWDQKYAAWVGSMQKIPAVERNGSRGTTYELVTPYGKTLPAPSLECAETAMFLRATFAAWYGLPFYMEARDGKGQRVFVGHFGARTLQGRWGSSPAFANWKDASQGWKAGNPWPSDAQLRKQALVGTGGTPDDPQPMIAADAHFGAYADEIFLNKRAGYLIVYILNFFYSGSLADPVNTYNVKPEAIREGDVLIRRWQRNGIGHTLVVKHMSRNTNGEPMAELVAGGMPRHQGEWTDEVEGKQDLSLEDGGGLGHTDDKPPIQFWSLGGGLKRWRAPRAMNGAWVNTYLPEDQRLFISSTDSAQLTPRPSRLAGYLGEVPPEQKRDALLKMIDDARANLAANPSSCESRKNREDAFGNLYALSDKLHTTPEAIEKDYRHLDDFVFHQLGYANSKTCCWDSSSPSMYRVIMDYAAEEQAAAKASMMCKEPTVFRARAEVPTGYGGVRDGYQLWRDWAAKKGRSAEWIDSKGAPAQWHEDEQCEQRAVTEDSESSQRYAYCAPPPPPPDPTDGAPPAGDEPDLAGDAPDLAGDAPDGGA